MSPTDHSCSDFRKHRRQEDHTTQEKTMQTGKRLTSVLCLVSLPLFAQNGQQPSMQMTPGMVMEKSPQPPAELLPGIAARTPLKLEYFLDSADRNNPTLQQAAAIVRRSEAQARQASLYPNPTAG